MIRYIIVISDSKRIGELVGGISQALILTGCAILIGLRILIPLFDLAAGRQMVAAAPQREFMLMD
jgi:hypothetical protein